MDLTRSRSVDWRTVDLSTVDGEGLPIEELRFYQEKLGEMLSVARGRFVLIVGREIVAYFDDLDSAAQFAAEHHRSRFVLIKKVDASEPIHSLGGAELEPIHSTLGSTG